MQLLSHNSPPLRVTTLVIQWYTIVQHRDIYSSFQVPQKNLGSRSCAKMYKNNHFYSRHSLLRARNKSLILRGHFVQPYWVLVGHLLGLVGHKTFSKTVQKLINFTGKNVTISEDIYRNEKTVTAMMHFSLSTTILVPSVDVSQSSQDIVW